MRNHFVDIPAGVHPRLGVCQVRTTLHFAPLLDRAHVLRLVLLQREPPQLYVGGRSNAGDPTLLRVTARAFLDSLDQPVTWSAVILKRF
jgi:hypothetical protein